MKPLELHIYEKHPDTDAYRVGGFYSPYCLVSRDKRFSEAELAAEAYRQMTRAIAESGMCGDGFDIIPGDAVTFGPNRCETSRLGDVKRFAVAPHYDEADQ